MHQINIIKMGNPQLHQVSQPITEFNTPELRSLIKDLINTKKQASGVGIAAPQIGILKRVIVMGFEEDNSRYPEQEPIPMTAIINPSFTPLSNNLLDDWEGCLSLPGLRGLVPRYQSIKYRGYDKTGSPFEKEARDFEARIIQHEIDHLDGILYIERVKNLHHFGFTEEIQSFQMQASE